MISRLYHWLENPGLCLKEGLWAPFVAPFLPWIWGHKREWGQVCELLSLVWWTHGSTLLNACWAFYMCWLKHMVMTFLKIFSKALSLYVENKQEQFSPEGEVQSCYFRKQKFRKKMPHQFWLWHLVSISRCLSTYSFVKQTMKVRRELAYTYSTLKLRLYWNYFRELFGFTWIMSCKLFLVETS